VVRLHEGKDARERCVAELRSVLSDEIEEIASTATYVPPDHVGFESVEARGLQWSYLRLGLEYSPR
jgi:hypothetical protein